MSRTEFEHYLREKAPVLYLELDPDGNIRRLNRFAEALLGVDALGEPLPDKLFDANRAFRLDEAIAGGADEARLLNFQTRNGVQTFQCHFYSLPDGVIVFGHMDIGEIEALSRELVAANQELNNLMRELNAKNRELSSANARILELTRTDPLTGLANRRYFDERIRQAVSLAQRQAQPLTVVMTDIDHFKSVNDRFGHDVGDRVLKGYARLMTEMTRTEDLVARWGGEEFILMLPVTGGRQAREVTERIRVALPQKDLAGNGHRVTASFGISQLLPGESIAELIKRADTALYQAKHGGRNRTMVSA
jgi:diguanylate cyclase (GGDEF)-like protein